MPAFARTTGIDYSGAETPTSSLKSLSVYLAEGEAPPSPRKYWTRRGVAEWLVERLSEDEPTLVGIDHGSVVVGKAEQAAYARAIFPDASNTVRVVAMRHPRSREVFVPVAVHRFGAHNTAPVDNWSRGGLSCQINMATGEMGEGIRHPSITEWQMRTYDRHPDSGSPVAGVKIPHWDKLLAIVAFPISTLRVGTCSPQITAGV